MQCLLCLRNNAKDLGSGYSGLIGSTILERTVKVECDRCGDYIYTNSSFEKLMSVEKEKRPLLSCWAWEQNHSGNIPLVTSDNVVTILSSPLLAFSEKVKRLLIYSVNNKSWPMKTISTMKEDICAMLQTDDGDEIRFIVKYMEECGYVRNIQGGTQLELTGDGIIKADEFRRSDVRSFQGFVAMSFDPSMDAAWTDGFEPGIRSAGYKARRIDDKEYVGGIVDEIMSEIRLSRFIIADYTRQANGVYFEAGFALGLGLTVIPTCKADEISKLHFDIRHLNTLPWNSPAELAEGLARRIRAVVGVGPAAAMPGARLT